MFHSQTQVCLGRSKVGKIEKVSKKNRQKKAQEKYKKNRPVLWVGCAFLHSDLEMFEEKKWHKLADGEKNK